MNFERVGSNFVWIPRGFIHNSAHASFHSTNEGNHLVGIKLKGSLGGGAALALLLALVVPPFAAHADEQPPLEETVVSEEVTPDVIEEAPASEIVEETTVPEEVPPPVEETQPEETTQSFSASRATTQVQSQDTTPNTNSTSYWEGYTAINDKCYKHEGGDLWNNAHGYLSDDGINVILKDFVQAWFGDHYSLLVVNSGSVDNGYGPGNAVYPNPTAGLPGYKGPLNNGGQQGTVSHWIVCKGATPDDPKPEPVITGNGYACTSEEREVDIPYVEFTVSYTGEPGDPDLTFQYASSESGGPSGTWAVPVNTEQVLQVPFTPGIGEQYVAFDYQAVFSLEESPRYFVETDGCDTPPPPVVEQCEAQNPTTHLNTTDGMFFEDGASGDHAMTEDGLNIWTYEPQGATSKSAGYIPVDIPFEEVGTPYLNVVTNSGQTAGLNLTIFKDGAWFGNLVLEPLFDDYWTNKVVPGMPAGPNPGYQKSYGTLDAFLAAFIANGWDVDVKAIGYSLGSNAIGDNTVIGLGLGCDSWTFGLLEATVDKPLWVDPCGPNNGHWVYENTEAVTWTVTVNPNGSQTITAEANEGYYIPEGTKTEWTKKDYNEPCPPDVIATPPAPEAGAPTCAADGTLPELEDGEFYTAAWDREFDGPGTYTATYTISVEGYTFESGTSVSHDVEVLGKLTGEKDCPPVKKPEPPKELALTGVDVALVAAGVGSIVLLGILLVVRSRRERHPQFTA